MKKYTAIWGAGFLGGRESVAIGKYNLDFFIDANVKKRGTTFGSKPVIWVGDVDNWNDLYIYIPRTYFLSIAPILEQNNLQENIDYELFDGKIFLDYSSMKCDYSRAIKELFEHKDDLRDKILFWGWDFSEKRSYNKYFKAVQSKNPAFSYAVIAENLWVDRVEAEKKNEAPTIMAPNVFCYESFLKTIDESIDETFYNKEEAIILKATERLKKFCPKIEHECAVMQVICMLKYIDAVLEILEPQCLFLSWHRNVRSMLIEYRCKQNNIIIYAAPGVIPGTYLFDTLGEMGRCLPNYNIVKFRESYVSEEDIINARNLIAELRRTGESRKVQQDIEVEHLFEENRMRPTIMFAAQPDTDFTPYDEEVRNHYSPIFETSREAGIAISKLCKENGWNYIFKSHPMYPQDGIENELAEGTIYVEQGDINKLIDAVDLVITIQSSVSYTAMIRNKPIVMLGYNQMRGKGCVYEAFDFPNIEKTIKQALLCGVTEQQRNKFIIHVAQLLKYYLYDDLSHGNNLRGKNVFSSIDEIVYNEMLSE